jgi:hypothetical protein
MPAPDDAPLEGTTHPGRTIILHRHLGHEHSEAAFDRSDQNNQISRARFCLPRGFRAGSHQAKSTKGHLFTMSKHPDEAA